MMISWLFYALVVSAAVTASALAFEVAARALGLARRVVWSIALGGVVVLPVLLPALARTLEKATPLPADGAGLRLPAITITGTPAAQPLLTDGMILAALLGAAAVGIVVLVAAHGRLSRAERQWRVAEMDGVSLRISAGVGPAVLGWWRPVIVVPEWIVALDAGDDSRARAGARARR